MSLLNLFKLEKLRIEGFKAEGRGASDFVGEMELMFNPTTLQEKHAVTYQSARIQAINSAGKPALYSHTPPGDLSFQFLLDGTGVNFMGVEQLARTISGASVKKDIAKFKKLCLEMNGDIHQPNFLKISWGDFKFSCRLANLDITYKLFDESGDPLRADLSVKFVKDKSAKTIALESDKKSPDLTHLRTVKAGDTLPLLCKEIYGSSAHYLRVAADNRLDDFRNLVPGQQLRFAPLPRSNDPARG
ncbi:conserved hypothetical protein [Rubrivivax sp. A210]|uniref:CIS tube protein n=1 Tax=Rubrivivax sp. A210 TaxID=2772301 RepID=UPI001919B967|nr:hypothetical protein [Rubrivivax sp. A210]CAD5372266.1 conserved hypothetical protein [Rubrivivax sp. A210]